MALIITLSMIVLVSVAILAFFSMVTADMKVEASRGGRVRADLIAQSGGVHAAGRVIAEITGPDFSVPSTIDGFTVYTPRNRTNAVPLRQLSAAIPLNGTNFVNLVRQSIPSADPAASGDSTSGGASDGRTIDTGRWSAPLLVQGGFTATNQLPNWVYVHGTQGATNTPSPGVIGRFAYNVYNIGGALNANAAGFRDSVSAEQLTRLKAMQSGSDMTALSTSISAADVTKLTEFRNPDAVTAAGYMQNASAAREDGFLSTLSTNLESGERFHQNLFSSRQDLLRYVRTQNTGLRNAAPYLTHFSRSLSAPSWRPVNPPGSTIDYEAKAEDAASPNRNIPNVRFGADGTVTHYTDDGKPITRTVKAGDPMVTRRFSLARLAWLTPTGPSSTVFPTAVDGEAPIQAVFGLRWNSASERWDYVGAEPTPQAAIKTLGEVAAEAAPREPNFFEMLKAGILEGSLGTVLSPWTAGTASSGTDYASYAGTEDTRTYQANKDMQLLRIGASIIDCADADNYPTCVALTYGTVAVEAAGVEDLPYIWGIAMTGLRETDGTSASTLRIFSGDLAWVPVFLNPHRTPVTPATLGPDAVRFEFASGVLKRCEYNGAGSIYPQTMTKNFASLGSIDIPRVAGGGSVYGFEDYRVLPRAALTTEPLQAQRLDQLAFYTHPETGEMRINIDAPYGNFRGFRLFSWQKEYTGTGKVAGTYGWWFKPSSSFVNNGLAYFVHLEQLNMVMRYRTPGGAWKTYATLGGNEALPTTGLNGAKNDGVSYPTQVIRFGRHFNEKNPATGSYGFHGLERCYYLFTHDPRTSRIGPIITRHWDYGVLPPNTYTSGMGNSGPPPVFLPQAGKGSTNVTGSFGAVATNWADPDGIFRPTDGFLSATGANPYRQVSGGQFVPGHASRPTLLQRPYRSVAELGYVFRDTPWKSLSFFDETSGDSGLLDLFTVADEPEITDGRFDLNAILPQVKQAALSQVAIEPYLGEGSFTPTTLSATTVNTASTEYGSGSAYAFINGLPTANVPFSVAQLANFMSAPGLSSAGLDVIKTRREALVRGLADVSQTRTWTLLIDVVAQSGQFPPGTSTADRFVVEGEQRYWLSVSIDRYTGKIVAQQMEAVHE
ncbi:hypothetical protein DB346_03360 [Verrucomicrobia bacterium LW23]|nr:hypothetical protein DB346_03360 [Verrucomicrobia bacterium LW23]